MLRYRSASVGAVVAAFAALQSTDGRASEPPRAEEQALAGTMSCERAAEPGRVKCAVEVRAAGGRSISWADVAILELPAFTSALKGRIGPGDATYRDAASQRWAFGLVARTPGNGEAKARIRAVVCDPSTAGDAASSRCVPATVDVRAVVHVG